MVTITLAVEGQPAVMIDARDFDEGLPEDLVPALLQTIQQELRESCRCRCGEVAGDSCDAWGTVPVRYVEASEQGTHVHAQMWQRGWASPDCLDALENAGLEDFVEVLA